MFTKCLKRRLIEILDNNKIYNISHSFNPMNIKDRVVTFPRMGNEYTKIIKNTFENLGLNVKLPPRTTDKTIQIGVRNTAEMFCYPIKPTLGNFAEALENGVNTLIMYDSMGTCRFKQYWKIHEFTLKNMGYEFEMYNLSTKNIVSQLKKISKQSGLKVRKELFNLYKNLKEYDQEKLRWSKNKPNIGIIGEVFCCCDERTNYGIEKKLSNLDVKPVNTVTLSGFINDSIKKGFPFKKDKLKKYKKEAQKYLNGNLGGHGIQNLYNLLNLSNKEIDGIIHLLPLSCSPEVAIEVYVNSICQINKIPLLRIPIDENTAEANLETRLETFCELIKMRKEKQNE